MNREISLDEYKELNHYQTNIIYPFMNDNKITTKEYWTIKQKLNEIESQLIKEKLKGL